MNDPLIQFSLEEFFVHELQKEAYAEEVFDEHKSRMRIAAMLAQAVRQNWVKLRV